MNILSLDIEEWYLGKEYFGAKDSTYAAYDRLLDELLEKMLMSGHKGTFFCIGKMAIDFPKVVRKISDAGHEVGCHSNRHQWLNKLSFEEVFEDTRVAIDSLQQCIGKKVVSYRAPAFSIGSNNKWAFEVLATNGITCDASVFPATRDFGGFPELSTIGPSVIKYHGIELHEFPIATSTFVGKEIAYSGGGYFRFFPFRFIEREMRKATYSMSYFHLGDFYPVIEGVLSKEEYERYFNEPGTLKARYLRYFKTNYGVKGNKKKLFKMLDNFEFMNILEADSVIDWSNSPVVSL